MASLDFNIENLENRQLMAGDVSVDVTGGGDLRIEGDDAGNEIVIRALPGANAFQIQGVNGTQVNGRGVVLVEDVTDDVRINLGDGNNKLLMTGFSGQDVSNPFNVADRLDIRTGDGNDIVLLHVDGVGGQARVRTGDGDDVVVVYDSAFQDRLRIDLSDGNDTVLLQDSEASGRTDVNMGDDDDAFVALQMNFGDRVRVRGQDGDDIMAIGVSSFAGRSDFDGGSDADTLLEDTQGNQYADRRTRNQETFGGLDNLNDLVALEATITALNPTYQDAVDFANQFDEV